MAAVHSGLWHHGGACLVDLIGSIQERVTNKLRAIAFRFFGTAFLKDQFDLGLVSSGRHKVRAAES
jgi:hypothetical protein